MKVNPIVPADSALATIDVCMDGSMNSGNFLSDASAVLEMLSKDRQPVDAPLLSVVMPAYNERATIAEIVRGVLRCPVASRELIIVDDGSTDGTRELLTREIASLPGVRVLLHETNRGKGAALRTGFREAKGEYVIVQDADLEYEPNEYPRLLEPMLLDWPTWFSVRGSWGGLTGCSISGTRSRTPS